MFKNQNLAVASAIEVKLKAIDKSNPVEGGMLATVKLDADSLARLTAVVGIASKHLNEPGVVELANTLCEACLTASENYDKKHNLSSPKDEDTITQRVREIRKERENMAKNAPSTLGSEDLISEIVQAIQDSKEEGVEPVAMPSDENQMPETLADIARALEEMEHPGATKTTNEDRSVKVGDKVYNPNEQISCSSPEEASKIIEAIKAQHPGVKIVMGELPLSEAPVPEKNKVKTCSEGRCSPISPSEKKKEDIDKEIKRLAEMFSNQMLNK